MKITYLTLFPEFYDSYKEHYIIKRAVAHKLLEINTVDIRSFSEENHQKVDDTTIGGGPGLIMKCEPIVKAINSVKTPNSKVIFLSSKGEMFTQKKAHELKDENKDLILLCGHYEGIDERVMDYVDEEICIGNYILTGGELPSLVVSDAIIRLIDGAINEESTQEESFENGLLEYPQFTFPRVYEGKEVPEILFTGNHKAIDKWRKKESLRLTLEKRKDLFFNYKLSKEELLLLEEIKENRIGKWEMDAIYKSKKIKIHDYKINEDEYELYSSNKRNIFIINNNDKGKEIHINDKICFIRGNSKKEFIYKDVIEIKSYNKESLINMESANKLGFNNIDNLNLYLNEFDDNVLVITIKI